MDIPEYLKWLEGSFGWTRNQPSKYGDPAGCLNDRLIRHDMIHMLMLGEPKVTHRLRYEDEYANGTIQAVLEGTSIISTHALSQRCGRQVPGHEVITEKCIREVTIPQLVAFIRQARSDRGLNAATDYRTGVSSEFIKGHIAIGHQFRRVFRQKYGAEWVSKDVRDLMGIPFSELQEVYASAKMQVLSARAVGGAAL